MRKDIGMRSGKMISQGSHASIKFLSDAWKQDCPLKDVEEEWLHGSFVKICVRVESEEELLAIHQAALDADIRSEKIIDSGLTEFHGERTLTCIAIGPDFSSKIDKITGHLKLL